MRLLCPSQPGSPSKDSLFSAGATRCSASAVAMSAGTNHGNVLKSNLPLTHCSLRTKAGDGLSSRQVTGTRTDRKKRSEEHTSELQSRLHLVCRLLLEKKK